ncbi:MAG: hypothetical protein L0Y64_26400 [Myxococcaceae bacterium]|nr:hypothetical protein [Myxococcaceae bacterium]
MERVAAAVCVDAAPMHFAAAVGTPTVALFPTFPPAARVGYYPGQVVALTPPAGHTIRGEGFPAGEWPRAKPGEWQESITVDAAFRALCGLLNLKPPAPRLVK